LKLSGHFAIITQHHYTVTVLRGTVYEFPGFAGGVPASIAFR
jgi:hypothetical protein